MSISHNFTQGSSSWHAFRAEHFGASEASAMLGLSPYTTRNELLLEKKTGLTKDINAATQKVFDKGNLAESLARPIVEKMIGEELSPMTFSKGMLSASSDGVSFMGDIAWENKQFNKAHFEQVKNGELPEIHWPQCQQVLYCSGAKKLFFTISDGTEDKTVGVWVHEDSELQAKIVNGWAQFERDLETYVPPVVVEKVEAETIQTLPVPSVVVRGEITTSNLSEITPLFDSYLGFVKSELSTDQDFADAEANAKNCRETATRIKSLRANIIAQMVDVNAVDSTLANYEEAFNKVGLRLEKAVKEQKESIKTVAILKAQQDYAAHVKALEIEIAPIRLNLAQPDFAKSISGVKSMASMHSRLNDALAGGKIESDAVARDIRNKLAWYKESAKDYEFLFNDLNLVIHKAMDDFQMLVNMRVSEHKKASAEREAVIKATAEAEALAKREKEELSIAQAQYEAELIKPVDIKSPPIELRTSKRPTDDQIIEVLALHFRVHESSVLAWLGDMDLKAAINRMATEFKAA